MRVSGSPDMRMAGGCRWNGGGGSVCGLSGNVEIGSNNVFDGFPVKMNLAEKSENCFVTISGTPGKY